MAMLLDGCFLSSVFCLKGWGGGGEGEVTNQLFQKGQNTLVGTVKRSGQD